MNRWTDIETRHGSGAYSNWPITLSHGKGCRVWDTDGNSYLDFATGIGVAGIGHANPVLAEAIADQAKTLLTCNSGYYANETRARFIEKLSEICPGDLKRVFISNSGAESIETAIKLARAITGRSKIISAMRGFHGRTFGSLSATWKKEFRQPFNPLVPEFLHVPYGNIEALADAISDQAAAVLLEPIQGEGGVYLPPEDYLKEVRELCNKAGVLLIFDEVQTGMGRTGKWFAGEHFHTIPDIMCLAKMLGGGVPIGATVMLEKHSFARGQHGSTFGGNPLSCRAALTTIEYIEEHKLVENAADTGNYFLTELRGLAEQFSQIREVRGLGLMVALQLRFPVKPIMRQLMESGVLTLSSGKTILRFLPPLIVSKVEIDDVLTQLKKALS
ncbi:MAG: acetylornithine/succinylornithine family transaminase [Simkaniaceae bacterium]|nr:acetylornithine/succinylornithine family transaminase [Simkaniaceae bacterium]